MGCLSSLVLVEHLRAAFHGLVYFLCKSV